LPFLTIYHVFYEDPDVLPAHVFEVCAHLARAGHRVSLFSRLDPSLVDLSQLANLGVTLVRVPGLQVRGLSEPAFLASLARVLAPRAREDRPDALYVRHSGASAACAVLARALSIPLILEVNDNTLARTRYTGVRRLKSAWIRAYERFAFPRADLIFPVTDGIRDWIAASFPVAPDRVQTLENGVDDVRFSPLDPAACRERFAIPPDRPVAGYLGSFFEWAGLDLLVEAAPAILEKVPNALFVLGGGEEPCFSRLQELAREAGISHAFRFFGRVPYEDAPAFINTMDLCLAPANFTDPGTGISAQKVMAYLACGKPVAGSDIRGLGDLLEREGAGVSFPMGDPGALARAVAQFLPDAPRLAAMGQAGRTLAQTRSWSVQTAHIAEMAGELSKRRKRGLEGSPL